LSALSLLKFCYEQNHFAGIMANFHSFFWVLKIILFILAQACGVNVIKDLNTKLEEFSDCTIQLTLNNSEIYVEPLTIPVQIVTEPGASRRNSKNNKNKIDLSVDQYIKLLANMVLKYPKFQCTLRISTV